MSSAGTLVYVPGASDRSPGIADHVARIEAGLAVAGMDLTVVPSLWGDAAGAKLDRIDLALPRPASDPLGWLLRDGPLADAGNPAADPDPGAVPTAPPVGRDADLMVDLVTTMLRLHDSAGGEAQAASTSSLTVTPTPAPMATVDLGAGLGAGIANATLAAAAAAIVAGYVGIDVGPGLKRWATEVILPQRSRLMRESLLGIADVLLYQRNGEPIRQFVAQTLKTALAGPRPVVALGSSLGSIVLVDTLREKDAPRPDLCVTVGSQAPILEAFGALGPPDPANPRPPFVPWLNIYDRRDLVGFVAAPVWSDQAGIVDVEVDSGLGFPDSHGLTYLSLPAVYDAIHEHLERLPPRP